MKLSKTIVPSKAIKIEIKDGKKTVGRAFLYLIYNQLHKRPYGLMEDVFVDESMRRQGIGTQLIKEVFSQAKKYKCYKLIATSRFGKPKVHKLYTRLGFAKHGVEFRINF